MFDLRLIFSLCLLCSWPVISWSQTCPGSKGDNIFPNGDFGSGVANIVPTDPGIAPGYVYITNPPPYDGEYTVTNDLGAWANRFTWLPLTDNSPDPNGYFLVINASFSTGLFYEQQVTGLCENTTYEFSADIINLIPPGTNQIEPNVSFLLDSVFQISTGNIPENATWTTYGFTFSTLPGQTSVTLALRNNAPGGFGNDIGIDNISFRPCGPNASIIPQQPQIICEDSTSRMIEALLTNNTYSNPVFQWQTSSDSGASWSNIPGADDTSLIPAVSGLGTYYFRYLVANSLSQLSNSKCRVTSDVKIITVIPKFYRVTDSICSGDSYSFGGNSIATSGVYTDTFTSYAGCDSIVELTLTVLPNQLSGLFLITPPSCDSVPDAFIELDSILNGFLPYVIQFDGNPLPGRITPNTLSPGDYSFSIEDKYGCRLDTTIQVPITTPFTINLGPDRMGLVGDTFVISTQSNYPIASYNWSPNSLFNCTSGCSPITIQPNQSREIVLLATSNEGCVAVDTLSINIALNPEVYFPNAFTPNGDGLNDVFGPVGLYPKAEEVRELLIYNRWGETVYQAENISLQSGAKGWDGTISGDSAPMGTYVYLARIQFIDGSVSQYYGYVVLLR